MDSGTQSEVPRGCSRLQAQPPEKNEEYATSYGLCHLLVSLVVDYVSGIANIVVLL
jgi:hypothetical protein